MKEPSDAKRIIRVQCNIGICVCQELIHVSTVYLYYGQTMNIVASSLDTSNNSKLYGIQCVCIVVTAGTAAAAVAVTAVVTVAVTAAVILYYTLNVYNSVMHVVYIIRIGSV